MIVDWIEHHRRGIGWDPHPISLRVFSWGKLLLSADSLPAEQEDELFANVNKKRRGKLGMSLIIACTK